MANKNDFKQFRRQPRNIVTEENYSRGMYVTDTGLNAGAFKHSVNFDLDAKGGVLTSRKGLQVEREFDVPVGRTVLFSEQVVVYDPAGQSTSDYANLICLAPTANKVLHEYMSPDGVLCEMWEIRDFNLCTFLCDRPETGLQQVYRATVAPVVVPFNVDLGPKGGVSMHHLSDVKVAPKPLYFILAQRIMFMGPAGICELQITFKNGQYLYNPVLQEAFTPDPYYAVSRGYNMLLENPYKFSNRVGDSWSITGFKPYDALGNLCFAPKLNERILLELYYTSMAEPVLTDNVFDKPPEVRLSVRKKTAAAATWDDYVFRGAIKEYLPLEPGQTSVITIPTVGTSEDTMWQCILSYDKGVPNFDYVLYAIFVTYSLLGYGGGPEGVLLSDIEELFIEAYQQVLQYPEYGGSGSAALFGENAGAYAYWLSSTHSDVNAVWVPVAPYTALDFGSLGEFCVISAAQLYNCCLLGNPFGFNVWKAAPAFSSKTDDWITEFTNNFARGLKAFPPKDLLKRLGFYNTHVLSVSDLVVQGSKSLSDRYGYLSDIKPVKYDILSAKGCCSWSRRAVLWGVPDAVNTLFLSDIDRPNYFPYYQDVVIFDEPVIDAVPYKSSLIVFTPNNLYKVDLTEDGMGYTQKAFQAGLPFTTYDKSFTILLKNMIFFKDGNSFKMLVPSTRQLLLTGELTVAPISRPLTDMFDSFDVEVCSVLHGLFSELFPEHDLREPYEIGFALEMCRSFMYNDFIGIDYYINSTVLPRLLYRIVYSTADRTWSAQLYEIDPAGTIIPHTFAHSDGQAFAYATGSDKFRIISETSETSQDSFIYVPQFLPPRQYLDTGYRKISEDVLKKFREVQYSVINKSDNPLEFKTTVFLDSVAYPVVHPPMESHAVFGETAVFDEWVLSRSALNQGILEQLRFPVTGKGRMPRLQICGRNSGRYEIQSHSWVHRIMNAR